MLRDRGGAICEKKARGNAQKETERGERFPCVFCADGNYSKLMTEISREKRAQKRLITATQRSENVLNIPRRDIIYLYTRFSSRRGVFNRRCASTRVYRLCAARRTRANVLHGSGLVSQWQENGRVAIPPEEDK